MSVDSTELQRATLERKKADELNVIATALGVKPGSRAKKADLVDLILAATGVTGPRAASAASSTADVVSDAGAAAPVATADAASASAAATVTGNGSVGNDEHVAATAPAERTRRHLNVEKFTATLPLRN